MTFIPLAIIGTIAGAVIMLIIRGRQKNRAKERSGTRAAKNPPHKKRLEFSKRLAVWAAITGTVVIIAAVLLSLFDKQPLESLFITVFSACSGYLVTYAGKTAFEKNSRNKHGLDENGNPYNVENDGGSENEHNTIG